MRRLKFLQMSIICFAGFSCVGRKTAPNVSSKSMLEQSPENMNLGDAFAIKGIEVLKSLGAVLVPEGKRVSIFGLLVCVERGHGLACDLYRRDVDLGYIVAFSKKVPADSGLVTSLTQDPRVMSELGKKSPVIIYLDCEFDQRDDKILSPNCQLGPALGVGEFLLSEPLARSLAAHLAQDRPFQKPSDTLSAFTQCSRERPAAGDCGVYLSGSAFSGNRHINLTKEEQLELARDTMNAEAVFNLLHADQMMQMIDKSALARISCFVDSQAYAEHKPGSVVCSGKIE